MALLVAALSLVGCEDAAMPFAGLSLPKPAANSRAATESSARRQVARQISASAAGIAIVGPRGYCVDAAASEPGPPGGFVVLRRCSDLGAGGGLVTPPKAVLTAAISAQDTARPVVADGLGRLAEFFSSREGRAALSRDARADTVTLLRSYSRGSIFYLHARDTSGSLPAGLKQDYWRALFDMKGRIVTITVTAMSDSKMTNAQVEKTLNGFVAAVKRANSG